MKGRKKKAQCCRVVMIHFHRLFPSQRRVERYVNIHGKKGIFGSKDPGRKIENFLFVKCC